MFRNEEWMGTSAVTDVVWGVRTGRQDAFDAVEFILDSFSYVLACSW